MRAHEVSIVVNGAEIRGWSGYDIKTSILDPVDTFRLELPFHAGAWERVAPDSSVKVTIDGVVLLDGFIDDRELGEGDETLQVSGRDRCGRLVQESAPGIDFKGASLGSLVAKLASPWFEYVTFSNARNRRVLRGKGAKARAGREPVFVTTSKGTRIEPGQTRMDAIADLCRQAEVMVWSAGDGTELVVGKPNYEQAPQFHFFMPAEESRDAHRGNVLGLGYLESTGDRYSEIICVGTGGGTDENYADRVTRRIGRAVDMSGFTEPKRLIVERAVRSAAEAKAYAEREMRRRNMQGKRVTVRAAHHGQVVAGQHYTIFAPDLAATIEDERTGLRGTFHIVGCTYRCSRDQGEETILEFVPKGTELAT